MVAFVGALVLVSVAVGAGSRGPMLGLLTAVAVVAFRTRVGAALVAAVGVTAWYLLPRLLRSYIPDRLLSIDDGSARVRADAAELTLAHTRENFLGTGIGSLEPVIAPAGSKALYYPHNVVLEVAGEAGVLAAVVFIGVVIVVGHRLWRSGTTFGDNATLALLIYFFVNACVSGDVNSNRGLWLFLGVACAAAYTLKLPNGEATTGAGNTQDRLAVAPK